jgi:endoglucanase
MAEPHTHPVGESEFIDLATFGLSHGSDHVGDDGLVGGRTAITTEALLAYNDLRGFVGLAPATLDEVGAWAFANTLTNNTQAWGNDQQGVGLWYAMQGAKVGWMADDLFDPQVVADIERTARLGPAEDVMAMVVAYGHEGFAQYLSENGLAEAFINTLKMEPHYAGWMHDRAHGWLSIEDVAIAHDVNHLTVLSHDQMQPFMNDTWDWPQWPALDVSHARVLEYFQSVVVLGDPLGDHLGDLSAPPIQNDPVAPSQEEDPVEEESEQEDPAETPSANDPVEPPMEDDEGHDDGSHDHVAPPASSGDYVDITSWGTFHGSNHNSETDELVGGRTAITTEAHEAYNNLRAFLGLSAVTIEEVGEWAFAESLTNNSQAWGNDIQGVGLYYAMQGAKVGWLADEAYDPQILADIQRTARTVSDPAQMKATVMDMVRQYGHAGYADYLEQYGIEDTFINTLKMEPHYGGWMHGRTHGFRSIEGVAINHDVNHLTVLSWDQMQPFMNDTFDWPQWDALNVSDSGVIEYFQSMVSLGNPEGQNLESAPTPITPPETDTPGDPVTPPEEQDPVEEEPVQEDPAVPTLTGLSVEVEGELWWGGFTAELIVQNETEARLDSWSFRFISSHRITGEPWGVAVETVDLGNGFYEHRLSGTDWGQSISGNGSVSVGFNAIQGAELGNSGPLDADQLFDGGFLSD